MSPRRKYWYWFAVAVTAVLSVLYVQRRDLLGLRVQHEDSIEHVESLKVELEGLKNEEATMSKRVEGLDSDPLELEAAIRNSKSLVRQGETVYRVELPEDRNADKGGN